MGNLVTLIREAKNNDTRALEDIIIMFAPKVNKSLFQTSRQERDDLKQEVCMKIIEAVYVYNLEATPGFWDYLKLLNINDLAEAKQIGGDMPHE